MLVKQQPQISEKELAEFFPEADLILLEGFKIQYFIRKIEIIRKGNSAESVCNRKTDGTPQTWMQRKEMHCLYWKMFHSLNWTMQSVLQNLFCRIISGKEFHTVTSRGTE